MNIIICGAGRVGYTIAKILTEIDNPNTIDDNAVPEIEEPNAKKD